MDWPESLWPYPTTKFVLNGPFEEPTKAGESVTYTWACPGCHIPFYALVTALEEDGERTRLERLEEATRLLRIMLHDQHHGVGQCGGPPSR